MEETYWGPLHAKQKQNVSLYAALGLKYSINFKPDLLQTNHLGQY